MAETMTFILEGRDRLSRVLDRAGNSAKNAEKKLAAFGTAIPAAAAIAPFVGAMTGAGVAVAAFGAAVVPQIGALGEASQAQQQYQDAVAASGAASQAAVDAELAYHRTLAEMPPATREAAAALSVLKSEYRDYSDELADDTMPVFTKGLQLSNSLLPKTSGLVKGASGELDRLMTIAGGAMNTPGFDRFAGKVEDFAVGSLRRAVDGVVHFARVADTGEIGGGVREFMDFAEQQGPVVGDTLEQIAVAAIHVLTAASDVGVGLLQVANAGAKVVASLPPGLITTALQLAVAVKAVSLTHAGLLLVAGAFSLAATQITAARTAAAGAVGPVAKLQAAFMALSTKARLAVAATGIGLVVLAVAKLSSVGKSAPPDVDRLTTSLGELARTGKVSGEAAKHFGKDLAGLYDSVRNITDPSLVDYAQNAIIKIFTLGQVDSTASKQAQENLDAIDDSLVSLVQGGKADLAAAALDRLAAGYSKNGKEQAKFRAEMDEYRDAVAAARFEEELAAQSMGLFGVQAQKTQQQLAAQKLSADGLTQSIVALNNVNRAGLGAMNAFEQAIDDTTAAAKKNAGALHMKNGQLDLNSQRARDAEAALRDLAGKTDEATTATREQGKSWGEVSGIYERGRAKLIENAQAMGLTRAEAEKLASQILKTPDKTAMLRGDVSDLDTKIDKAQQTVDSLKQKRKTAVGAEKSKLDKEVAAAQAKLDALRQKKAVALQAIDKASKIAKDIKTAIDNIRGKTVDIYTVRHTINVEATAGRNNAKYNGYAGGGSPSAGEIAMVGEEGPELVLFGRAAHVFDAKTTAGMLRGTASAGQAAAQGLAAGLVSTPGVYVSARAMAGQVAAGIRDELQISSPSKVTAALAKDVGGGFIKGLTGSRDKIKAVSKDLASDIRAAFSGKKESSLLAMVDRQTKKLLDAAAKRDKIASRIAEAKSFASDVTKGARENASLSNLGMDREQVTAGGIKGGLAQKLAQVRQFTAYIKILAKKGLNKGLLRQILNMGPEAGYAYASALVGADKATFNEINSMQSQLDKSMTNLGRVGADILYDSGKNAGAGFLKGLEGQKKSIEKLMLDIAEGMQSAIRKALGIKSPSTVMAKLGAYSTEGLARGLVAGMPVLDRALVAVSDRVASTQPAFGRASVVGTGGGGMVVNIHVDGNVMDPHAVAVQIERVLTTLKRDRGGGKLSFA